MSRPSSIIWYINDKISKTYFQSNHVKKPQWCPFKSTNKPRKEQTYLLSVDGEKNKSLNQRTENAASSDFAKS
jgi:hypothetical protein